MLCLPNGSQESRDESHLQQDERGREGKTEHNKVCGEAQWETWVGKLIKNVGIWRKWKADAVTRTSKLLRRTLQWCGYLLWQTYT